MNITTLESLEQMRKKVAIKIMIPLAVATLVLVLIMTGLIWGFIHLYNLESTDKGTNLILIASSLLLMIFVWLGSYIFKLRKVLVQRYVTDAEYGALYRKNIVATTISTQMKNATYNPDKGMPESDFKQSGFPLFANPSSYNSMGLISGEIAKTNYTFAEVWAEQISHDPRDNSTQTFDLFRGIFFTANFSKNTNWNTIVYPNIYKYFSPLLVGKYSEEKAFANQNYQRVKLEDTEFEKYFEVYSTDQVEARYILSPALMQRMVDFKKNTKRTIQFSFKDSKIYFAIHYSAIKNLFQAPILRSVHDPKPLDNYLSDVKFMIDIIKELNLNSKLN